MTTTLTIVPIRFPGCDEPSYFAVMDQHGRERCSGTSEFDARTALARELVYYVADGWRIVAMTETEVTIERARFCEPSGLDEGNVCLTLF